MAGLSAGFVVCAFPNKRRDMQHYAQTITQLLSQLQRDGYSLTELGLVGNAYKLAVSLFTGLYRPSGKTFIAHLVGTASILSSLHAAPKVVAAGLVHAAYSHGDFGGWSKGISSARRREVRNVLGTCIYRRMAR